MELYEQILLNKLQGLTEMAKELASEIVALECYRIISEVKAVLEDENLDDPQCFDRIEKIISVFESHGLGSGTRHDFG